MQRCIFEEVLDGMHRVILRLLENLVIRFATLEFLTMIFGNTMIYTDY